MSKVYKPGKLIVIEGTDGIGKSTQIKRLQEHLEADGAKIATHHFPTYYSYQGKGIEKYLAGEYGTPEELSPYFTSTLYAYDRAITWRVKLKDLYRKGRTILLDRYTTSNLLYQSALITDKTAKRDFLDYIIDFEYNKLGIQQPDTVIYLYAPIELVSKLRAARTDNEGGIKNDVYERNLELLRKVDENARFVANYCGWTMIDCATKDGKKMRSIEAIHKDIYKAVTGKEDKGL